MTAAQPTDLIERVASAVHAAYLETAERLGWPVKPAMRVDYCDLLDDAKELDRATARAAIAAHDSELAAQLSKVEGERDAAEQALSQAYYLVTGKSPAWSSTFGQTELLEEIKESVNVLKASVRDSVFNNMLDRKP